MDNDLFLYNTVKQLRKFKVVGLLPNPHFQKCRFIVEKLHLCFPMQYDKPEIRAMLNLDWDEYLTKMRRRHGKPYYLLHEPVAVYCDGRFMGDDEDLMIFIKKICHLELNLDFQEIGDNELIKYFTNISETYNRRFVYLSIAIDERVMGSMLFMLYNDLVPLTCDNFLSRCTDSEQGYKRTRIQRVAKNSWIQFGDFCMKQQAMPCENYSVPHDRRGVLSMCNERRHINNSFQFLVTLEPTDWMDYNYVAFGQLIQGAEILNMLEKMSTYYEKPLHKIEITSCGEFTLCPQLDEEFVKALNPPQEALIKEIQLKDEPDSVLSLRGYKTGKYFMKSDQKSYLPFTRFSRMFDYYMKEITDVEEEQVFEMEQVKSSTSIQDDDKMRAEMFNSKTFYYTGDHVII